MACIALTRLIIHFDMYDSSGNTEEVKLYLRTYALSLSCTDVKNNAMAVKTTYLNFHKNYFVNLQRERKERGRILVACQC